MAASVAVESAARSGAAVRPPFEYAAWLVDLDGTLYRAGGVKLAMAAELAIRGWPSLRVIRAFRREHEQMRRDGTRSRDANPTASAFQQQVARTARRVGASEERVEQVVRRWMLERPGKWLRLFRRRDLLASLVDYRAAQGRTALVSDYPARDKLAALGAARLFDVVIANGEDGAALPLKPAPDSYRAAAERLGVPAGDCLVIGDRDDADGRAAAAAGMEFCHVRQFAARLARSTDHRAARRGE